jgi:hypothetical protein
MGAATKADRRVQSAVQLGAPFNRVINRHGFASAATLLTTRRDHIGR